MVAQTGSNARRKHFFTTSLAVLDQELEVSAMVTSSTVRATSPTAFFQIRSISALLIRGVNQSDPIVIGNLNTP